MHEVGISRADGVPPNAEPTQDLQEKCSLIAVTPAHADRYLSRVTRLSGILKEKSWG